MTHQQEEEYLGNGKITYDTVDGLIIRPHTPDGYWLIGKHEREVFEPFERAILHELRATHLTLCEEAKNIRIEVCGLHDAVKVLNQMVNKRGGR